MIFTSKGHICSQGKLLFNWRRYSRHTFVFYSEIQTRMYYASSIALLNDSSVVANMVKWIWNNEILKQESKLRRRWRRVSHCYPIHVHKEADWYNMNVLTVRSSFVIEPYSGQCVWRYLVGVTFVELTADRLPVRRTTFCAAPPLGTVWWCAKLERKYMYDL